MKARKPKSRSDGSLTNTHRKLKEDEVFESDLWDEALCKRGKQGANAPFLSPVDNDYLIVSTFKTLKKKKNREKRPKIWFWKNIVCW